MDFQEFPKMRYRADGEHCIVNDVDEEMALDVAGEYCYSSPTEAAEHMSTDDLQSDSDEPNKPRRGRPPNKPLEVMP